MSIRILKTRILKPIFAAIVLAAIALSAPAHAGEPRPWLCRDKPVFSSEHMMNYDLSARAGLQWQIFFMTYDPNSAHDGFEITDSKEVGLRGVTQSGKLPPGPLFHGCDVPPKRGRMGMPQILAPATKPQRHRRQHLLRPRRTHLPRDTNSKRQPLHNGPSSPRPNALTPDPPSHI